MTLSTVGRNYKVSSRHGSFTFDKRSWDLITYTGAYDLDAVWDARAFAQEETGATEPDTDPSDGTFADEHRVKGDDDGVEYGDPRDYREERMDR